MKILSIRFQNLNSLAGEWSIDFTGPEYAISGIFAITGPTGSGKTTLLDAICLALYGRTPRLERITESTNEIMSRHTGSCFSEVLFETKRGRFRCHWSQRRARQHAGGRLQQPRHEIVDSGDGRILESRIKDVARMVEEVTGMNFDQFTRSVLLAQGGFAAFLQASADERAPILEQITGTEIYSRLSLKVHQRKSEEQQKLQLLEAETAAVTLLSPEDRTALAAELAEQTAASKRLLQELNTDRHHLTWRTDLQALEANITRLEAEREQAEQRLREAVPQHARLERARAVQRLDGGFQQLHRLRTLQEQEGTEIDTTRQQHEAVEKQLAKTHPAREVAAHLLQSAVAARQQEASVAREIRALDVRLQGVEAQLRTLHQERAAAEDQRQVHAALLLKTEEAVADIGRELDAVRDQLAEHRLDEGLAEDLAVLQEIMKGVNRLQQRFLRLQAERHTAETVLRQAEHTAGQSATLLEHHRLALTQAENDHATERRELAALLAGCDPADLRHELELVTDRRHAVDTAGQLARRTLVLQGELAAATGWRQEADRRHAESKRTRAECAGRLNLQQQIVQRQEQIVQLALHIRKYDEERKRLVAGSPCPLCGATVHPYGAGVDVRPDAAEGALRQAKEELHALQAEDAALLAAIAGSTERLRQLDAGWEKLQLQLRENQAELSRLTATLSLPPESLEAELAGLDDRLQRLRLRLQALDHKTRSADAARDRMEAAKALYAESGQRREKAVHAAALTTETHRRLEEEIRATEADLRAALEEGGRRIAAYGSGPLTAETGDRILADLRLRHERRLQHKDREMRLQQHLATLRIDREREDSLVQRQTAELIRIDRRLQETLAQAEALRAERRARYQEKDPEREEALAAERHVLAERNLAEIEKTLHQLEKDRAILAERLAASIQARDRRAALLAADEAEFLQHIHTAGFEQEAAFHAARLREQEIEEIAAFLTQLTHAAAEITTLLQSKRESARQEAERRLTELSSVDLTQRIEERTDALHGLQQKIGMLQGRLEDDDAQRIQLQGRLEGVERQRLEYGRWLRLHDLIGSSDGKKFRNFAQGVTFEIVVGQANRNLQRMTGRYLLIRDPGQPLELNVIDTYQAGEIRSTKNLSGGESFIVSLALALGLAGMAGQTIRVDSLFLDEGFGTLDEEALETALETLSTLQQEGKVIGIISHVPALRERVATRIRVTPGPGGRSRLHGPGVTQS